MKFIRNPHEVMLVRLGAGVYNFGGSSDQRNSTTSNNSSDTYTTNTSTNTTTNTSYNTTDNNTNTVTQDRRTVNDHGVSVNADGSTVTTTNSGNSTDIYTDSRDQSQTTTNNSSYSSLTNYSTTDFGSVQAGMDLGKAAIKSNQELSLATVDASKYLVGTTSSLYQAQLDFATHLTEDANAEARNAIREVSAAAGNALNQVVSVASKPLNANDPQRLVIIVGLCVVGLVFFSKLK